MAVTPAKSNALREVPEAMPAPVEGRTGSSSAGCPWSRKLRPVPPDGCCRPTATREDPRRLASAGGLRGQGPRRHADGRSISARPSSGRLTSAKATGLSLMTTSSFGQSRPSSRCPPWVVPSARPSTACRCGVARPGRRRCRPAGTAPRTARPPRAGSPWPPGRTSQRWPARTPPPRSPATPRAPVAGRTRWSPRRRRAFVEDQHEDGLRALLHLLPLHARRVPGPAGVIPGTPTHGVGRRAAGSPGRRGPLGVSRSLASSIVCSPDLGNRPTDEE